MRHRAFWLSSVTIASCLSLLRLLGVFQIWELAAYDRLLQLRPPEPIDDRIVIVSFSETDLQLLGSSQISDQVMANLLKKIRSQKPRVIGLDFYRNLPSQPGYPELLEVFKTTPNLVGIAKIIGNEQGAAVTGNPFLIRTDRISARDVVIDVDGRVRRAILYPGAEGATALPSFGFRLALDYLESQGISPDPKAEQLTLQGIRFPAFAQNDGGYINADASGYQILLNPRGQTGHFHMISAIDVLKNRANLLLKDRIVLVGNTSAGDSDAFFTTYSTVSGFSPEAMSGVELHANLTSQILSTVLDRRPLMFTFPEWVEWLAMVLLSYGGVWVNSRKFARLHRLMLTLLLVLAVLAASYWLVTIGWWFPVVPAAIAILTSATALTMVEAQRLSVLSSQDELTRLANRRTFNEWLEREWARGVRSQSSLALIFCDVDYFKLYNDTYGHPKGDECLRQIAWAIQQATKRPADLAARYGGEEFVVLLPNTDTQGALQVAKDIQAEVQLLQIDHTGSRVSPFVTLSLGISSVVPSVSTQPELLVKAADLGLYAAKRKGRNQMVSQALQLPLEEN
ncbi:MAG: diguanylate cyclase [Leptolyngbyaceae cyanobacterium CSU_1_3]|nr:diguanylate cyclase [Leptolyngbyaceae cyanobacterium CSU_1_3]